MPRTGRRPGPNTTRAAILHAATRRFAQAGFDATSLRLVAADAGVDPAVVVHFFGSKDGLFQAAVGWPFDPAGLALEITQPGPRPLSERVARTFFRFWEEPATRSSLLAVVRSAMTNEASAAVLSEFVRRQLFNHVTELVDGPQAELRVNLAAAHLIGIAVLRYVLCVEPLASAGLDDLVDRVSPALSTYLAPEPASVGDSALRPMHGPPNG